MDVEKALKKIADLEAKGRELWQKSVDARLAAENAYALARQKKEEINAYRWSQLKYGDILTNGKQEVVIEGMYDNSKTERRFINQHVDVKPPAKIDGPRERIYKGWLDIGGFAESQGWHKKETK